MQNKGNHMLNSKKENKQRLNITINKTIYQLVKKEQSNISGYIEQLIINDTIKTNSEEFEYPKTRKPQTEYGDKLAELRTYLDKVQDEVVKLELKYEKEEK